MLSVKQIPFLESLIWLDFRLNPSLPNSWRTPLYQWAGIHSCTYNCTYPLTLSLSRSLSLSHTQTHIYVYIYIFKCLCVSLHMFISAKVNLVMNDESYPLVETFATVRAYLARCQLFLYRLSLLHFLFIFPFFFFVLLFVLYNYFSFVLVFSCVLGL